MRLLTLPILATLVVMFLAAGAFASPVESTLSITNVSQPGSPITIVGTVNVNEHTSVQFPYSFRTEVSLTNVSPKAVLAMVVMTDIRNATEIDLNNTRKDDYFFGSDSFEPNTVVMVDDTLGPYGKPRAEAELEPKRPTAIAKVEFVQFADGSVWGDPAAGKDLLRERRLALDELRFLENTSRMKGEQQFVEELEKPSQLSAILNLQQLYNSNEGDASAVLQKIASMLEQANLHRRTMRSATTQHQP
jgi:hypothetical protein